MSENDIRVKMPFDPDIVKIQKYDPIYSSFLR